ncbi:MAG: dethiobiotin synthase [Colwellia sp.]
MKKIFITATDTDAGKTFVACALTKALINTGKKVAVYKPIAAGCRLEGESLINDDAQLLSQFTNCDQKISDINPIAFFDPIAPHIAAKKVDREISISDITQGYQHIKAMNADVIITEGAGGWRLPLAINDNASDDKGKAIFLSDFAKTSQQNVILVVNMKLGCLNHALLTYEMIKADGLHCIGWIANSASNEQMSNLVENIDALEQLLPIPKMAQFSFYSSLNMSLAEKINAAAKEIDLTSVLIT